ncbi:hypothetical protein ABW21_db0202541 [Orbilia brochopaga]|nr:hypothetical protein ABW21_db0202541 [Drechslerella brochopaga]
MDHRPRLVGSSRARPTTIAQRCPLDIKIQPCMHLCTKHPDIHELALGMYTVTYSIRHHRIQCLSPETLRHRSQRYRSCALTASAPQCTCPHNVLRGIEHHI